MFNYFKNMSVFKFSAILIGTVIITKLTITPMIEQRAEMKELYQEANSYLENGDYDRSIERFHEIPSSYKDVNRLEKKASTLLINECETYMQEMKYRLAKGCYRDIERFQLKDFYESETGKTLSDMLHTASAKVEQAKRQEYRKNPPYVGMSVKYINDTNWGRPSETKIIDHIRGDMITYIWYICENGMQYKKYVDASKNGSIFFISSGSMGSVVSDIDPRFRKCPE